MEFRFSLFLLRLFKLCRALGHPLLRKALIRDGVLAASEHYPILRRNWNTIVDVGANRGQFALAARACSSARIFCFEPLPAAASVIRGLFRSDSGFSVHQAAVGAVRGRVKLRISAKDDSSSVLEFSAEQTELFPGTQEVGFIDVEIGNLGDFVARSEITSPALLKIDVQGFETQVITGAKTYLECFDFIYCECSFVELYRGQGLASDVIDLLNSLGFKLCGVFNVSFDSHGYSVQGDFLFRKGNRVDSVDTHIS